ncbi:olfactory receptor 1496-like [Paramacrobiotus metropolitanus]|uniref:olfactory receptor 1496-like n=1 Tax=Paramacrobiotus metropolitanus TaxID=2943436 RepID=UPI0024465743|nr:olfactory receptor 1496-like [Paramacrobiotus metropolitanus]
MVNVTTTDARIVDSFVVYQTELKIMVAIFTVVFVIGSLLSLTLFLIIAFQPRLRTGSGILLAHHQFMHVLQTGISNPFYMATVWGAWMGIPVRGVNCTVMHLFCKLFTFTEMWASLFLAVNRFVAFTYPHHYSCRNQRRQLEKFVLHLWLSDTTYPQLRTGSGILVAHQQFSHTLQTGITNPFYMATGWIVWLGLSIRGVNCTVMYFFCRVFTYTEIYASLFLAVNRCIALIFPHRYILISPKRAVILQMLLPWEVALLLSLGWVVPGFFGIGSIFGNRKTDCGHIGVPSALITDTVASLGLCIPLIIEGLCYVTVLIHQKK